MWKTWKKNRKRNQFKFIILQFFRSEVWYGSHWAKNLLTRLISGSSREESVSLPFQLLEATCVFDLWPHPSSKLAMPSESFYCHLSDSLLLPSSPVHFWIQQLLPLLLGFMPLGEERTAYIIMITHSTVVKVWALLRKQVRVANQEN